MHAGDGALKSSSVIPARVASMVKISIDDAQEYYENSLQNLNQEEHESYHPSTARGIAAANSSGSSAGVISRNRSAQIFTPLYLSLLYISGYGKYVEFAGWV